MDEQTGLPEYLEISFDNIAEVLRRWGMPVEPGLTDAEINAAEHAYGLQFPPDLRRMLQIVLPTGRSCYDWRNLRDPHILDMLSWPFEGMCFDIEHNNWWDEEWGPRPGSLDDCKAIARRKLDEAPKLIPLFQHRYIADRPNQAGNPVISAYQMDIIYYGADLMTYWEYQIFHQSPRMESMEYREIEFWGRHTFH